MMVHDRLLEMVDLYALAALPPGEEIELECHMVRCPSCEVELATALSVTAALIPDSEPPSHVWDRIVLELDSMDAGPMVISRPRNTYWTTLTTIAAAIAIVLAGLLIMVSDGRETLAAEAETARAEAGSVVADLVTGDTTLAEVILTAEGQGYVLPTESLVSLDVARTYQLWVITADEEVISVGVLGNAPGPTAFTWKGEASGFALTREVAGGVRVSAGDVVSVATG